MTGLSSNTNGHTQSDSRAARFEQRLWEAYQGLWDSIVDPSDAQWDDDGRWQLIGSETIGGGASSMAFSTEVEHRQIRGECRALAIGNEFAINAHENRISYIVGSGHTYRASPKKGTAAVELAAEVQQVLDEFLVANCWHRRQQEIVRRRDRDGEVFLRYFVSADGMLRVRFVEPAQVSTPASAAGDATAGFGIVTDVHDVEDVLAYYIDGTLVDADQIQHRKANVDGNVRRGLPLFYPVRKNLRRAEKLLRNMSVVAEIQSAIALIRRHQGATRSAVQQFVAAQADATTAAHGGAATHWKHFGPGTILDSHAGIDYQFPAQGLDAGSFVTVLQAELRAIASRLVMPEFMLTSDASNANYSSTMVAEGPAVKMFERLQAEQIESDLEVMWRAVRVAVNAGRLPREALTAVEIQAAAPSLAVRDLLKETQTARIEHASGLLSLQTWSQRRGLDYAQEQANIAEHSQRAVGQPFGK